MNDRCTQLKHDSKAVEELIAEMEQLAKKKSLTKTTKENLLATLTYFINHRHMMDYAAQVKKQLPIGSGVTEAACKTLVKQRLCGSGMRWKKKVPRSFCLYEHWFNQRTLATILGEY